jgi:hypothetical protein
MKDGFGQFPVAVANGGGDTHAGTQLSLSCLRDRVTFLTTAPSSPRVPISLPLRKNVTAPASPSVMTKIITRLPDPVLIRRK